MADFTKKIILIVLYWISEIRLISSSSPYCEFNLCKEDWYCCRYNECCAKTDPNETFYILAWVLTGLLIAAVTCGGLFKYKNNICRKFFTQSSDEIPFAA